MRLGRAFFCFAICVAAASVALAKPAADVHRTATAVDERYNHLHSLQAEFTEIYRGSGTEKTRQDALGVSFSDREAFCERRQRCVVLRAGRPAGAQNGGKKT